MAPGPRPSAPHPDGAQLFSPGGGTSPACPHILPRQQAQLQCSGVEFRWSVGEPHAGLALSQRKGVSLVPRREGGRRGGFGAELLPPMRRPWA